MKLFCPIILPNNRKSVVGISILIPIFIDRIALAKQGDNRIGSVRPSVCLSVCPSVRPSVNALTAEPFYQSMVFCLCVCNQGAFIENSADAVDQLLIVEGFGSSIISHFFQKHLMVAVILFYKVKYIYSLAMRACGNGQMDGHYQNYYLPTSQSIMIRVVSASGKQLERDESIFMIFISYILIIHCLLPEAGFTMLLHADLLSWDNRILPADKTFPVEAEWKRKEYLYHKIIYYFDRGKVS